MVSLANFQRELFILSLFNTGYKARQKHYLSHLSSYIAKLFWFVINNTAKALGDDNEKTVAITMITILFISLFGFV